jgi:hypothetical protein
LSSPTTVPALVYHGLDPFQGDEFDILLILLGLRPVAIFSNYTINVLGSPSEINEEARRRALMRDPVASSAAISAANNIIRALLASGDIDFAVDYLYGAPTPMPKGLEGGEGFPPFPADQLEGWNLTRLAPRMPTDPNGLRFVSENYPKFYRVHLYTSKHQDVARVFGRMVLTIRDSAGRGLCLPVYAQEKHGVVSILSPLARGYNGARNDGECVIPGYILSSEVEGALVQYPFEKFSHGNTVNRIWSKRLVGGEPFVSLRDAEARFILQAGVAGGKIVHRRFASENPVVEGALDCLERAIAEYNSAVVR